MNIVDFIRARLAEDEEAARMSAGAPWEVSTRMVHVSASAIADNKIEFGLLGYVASVDHEAYARHIARHDPARVLRQCVMLRAMLGHAQKVGEYERDRASDLGYIGRETEPYTDDLVYRDLASVWSDHPDYQPEWAEG